MKGNVQPLPAPQPGIAPAPPRRRRHGCRNCCLLTLLLIIILVAGFFAAGWYYYSTPTHPVEEEYETIPEYFGELPAVPTPDAVWGRGEARHG